MATTRGCRWWWRSAPAGERRVARSSSPGWFGPWWARAAHFALSLRDHWPSRECPSRWISGSWTGGRPEMPCLLRRTSRSPSPQCWHALRSLRWSDATRRCSRLDKALEEAQNGEQRMVLVSGEPGIGKSALAAVWALHAAQRGALVLAGRSPAEAVTSYQPFVEAIRPVVTARPGLIAGTGPRAHMLVRLFPDMAERLPRSEVQADPNTERYLLFEAVVRAPRSARRRSPLWFWSSTTSTGRIRPRWRCSSISHATLTSRRCWWLARTGTPISAGHTLWPALSESCDGSDASSASPSTGSIPRK